MTLASPLPGKRSWPSVDVRAGSVPAAGGISGCSASAAPMVGLGFILDVGQPTATRRCASGSKTIWRRSVRLGRCSLTDPDDAVINAEPDSMIKVRASSFHQFTVSCGPVDDEDALVEEITELEAERLWGHLDQEQRDAMVGLVRDALTRMARTVEVWLPEGVVPQSSASFAIHVLWKFSVLDENVILQRARSDEETRRRLEELRELADGSG